MFSAGSALLGIAWRFLGGLVSHPLGSAVAVLVAFTLWNSLVDNPRVSRETSQLMVARADLEAEQFHRKELERQITEGEAAIAALEQQLAALEIQEIEEDRLGEEERAKYEAELAAAGRRCTISDADLRWLQRHRKRK